MVVAFCRVLFFFLNRRSISQFKCQTFVYVWNAVFLNFRSELGFDVNEVSNIQVTFQLGNANSSKGSFAVPR